MAEDINELLELIEAQVDLSAKHIVDYENPHRVTKAQVGLSEVDNTSDMNKPVSNATASAIATLREETVSAVETLRVDTFSAIETLRVDTNNSIEELRLETKSAVTTLRTETHSMVNQVNTNIGTIVGELNSNIGVIAGEINKQILGTQSALATFKEENASEHTVIHSAIETLEIETNKKIKEKYDELNLKTIENANNIFILSKQLNATYVTEGHIDEIVDKGLYLMNPNLDGFPAELFSDWQGHVGLLKVVERLLSPKADTVIVQYLYVSKVGMIDGECVIGVRYRNTNNEWTAWDNAISLLDLSYTTKTSKKTTITACETLLVADENGKNICNVPKSSITSVVNSVRLLGDNENLDEVITDGNTLIAITHKDFPKDIISKNNTGYIGYVETKTRILPNVKADGTVEQLKGLIQYLRLSLYGMLETMETYAYRIGSYEEQGVVWDKWFNDTLHDISYGTQVTVKSNVLENNDTILFANSSGENIKAVPSELFLSRTDTFGSANYIEFVQLANQIGYKLGGTTEQFLNALPEKVGLHFMTVLKKEQVTDIPGTLWAEVIRFDRNTTRIHGYPVVMGDGNPSFAEWRAVAIAGRIQWKQVRGSQGENLYNMAFSKGRHWAHLLSPKARETFKMKIGDTLVMNSFVNVTNNWWWEASTQKLPAGGTYWVEGYRYSKTTKLCDRVYAGMYAGGSIIDKSNNSNTIFLGTIRKIT